MIRPCEFHRNVLSPMKLLVTAACGVVLLSGLSGCDSQTPPVPTGSVTWVSDGTVAFFGRPQTGDDWESLGPDDILRIYTQTRDGEPSAIDPETTDSCWPQESMAAVDGHLVLTGSCSEAAAREYISMAVDLDSGEGSSVASWDLSAAEGLREDVRLTTTWSSSTGDGWLAYQDVFCAGLVELHAGKLTPMTATEDQWRRTDGELSLGTAGAVPCWRDGFAIGEAARASNGTLVLTASSGLTQAEGAVTADLSVYAVDPGSGETTEWPIGDLVPEALTVCGKERAVVSATVEGRPGLASIDLINGTITKIAAGEYEDIACSPDGSTIAGIKHEKGKPNRLEFLEL